MRRRFNTREKTALYLAANGQCESCGTELQPGWHADHIHPFTAGGPTDVVNGFALCPSCNLKKGSTMTESDPRTRWQEEAVRKFMDCSDDFLVTATPGAGKTRAALSAAKKSIGAGRVARIIVVVPGDHLRRQWRDAALGFDIHLTAEHRNGDGRLPDDIHGAVVTYQQIASQPAYWRHLAAMKSTLVILDEPHHAGDQSSWGRAIREAFEPAARRLLLSGTPFRSDGTAIPFVRYDGNGVSIADFPYDYGIAVGQGVVRPVRFDVQDGEAVWVRDSQRRSMWLSEATDERDMRDAIRVLLDPSFAFVPTMFAKADKQLTRDREDAPRAGGLILAPSIDFAERYADIMEGICGEAPVIVHSDMPDASERIEAFSRSDQRWIIAVKMVSEGVDIPRLMVGIYCSNVLTEMWFRQVVGRLVRRDSEEGVEFTATLFIPQVAPLVEIAQRIEREADMALREAAESQQRNGGDGGQIALNFMEPIASSDAITTQSILSGRSWDESQIAWAESAAAEFHLRGHGANVLAFLERVGALAAPVSGSERVRPTATVHRDADKSATRTIINRKVNVLASRWDTPHSKIHFNLNQLCGESSIREATLETLQKRDGQLDEWLAQ